MNKMTSHISKMISTLLVCALMFSTCLKENFSDCPENIRVYFNFDSSSDEDQSKNIDRMNLYVFSNNGLFLYEYRDDSVNFSSDYYIDCSDLYPGKFRFIAWAGKDEKNYTTHPETFVRNKTTFQEVFLKLNQTNDYVTEVIPPLFYSALPATVTKSKEQYFEMSLELMTNRINIHTIGLPSDNYEYLFEIDDNVYSYLFDGSTGSSEIKDFNTGEIRYVSLCNKDEMNQINSTINILRLSMKRYPPQMQIYNKTTGRSLYPNNGQTNSLVDLIRKANPNVDFENTYTYDIVLYFGENPDEEPVIIINGWEVREQEDNLVN